MARSRHCDVCKGWHDLEEAWPSKCIGHFKRLDESNGKSIYNIGDIQPYKNVYGETIGGRKQHRDFLRARGVVEVGNEKLPERKPEAAPGLKEDIKRAISEVGGLK